MAEPKHHIEPLILLTGAAGQVGWELERALAPLGRVHACDRRTLELSDPEAVRDFVRATRPTLIVNAAAYTAVDGAEAEPELAMTVNGRAPGALAEEARRVGAALVHYSTDYVFDGAKRTPYTEDDVPNPLGVYGASKRAGEEAVLSSGAPALVLRTGWVYGLRGRNFLLTVRRLAAERDTLRVVDDQLGAPTWSRLIAEATAQILAQAQGAFAELLAERGGLYHLTCAGATSWCAFARQILVHLSGQGPPPAAVDAITTAEYPTPAARPPYAVLDNAKLARSFGVRLPLWTDALELALA